MRSWPRGPEREIWRGGGSGVGPWGRCGVEESDGLSLDDDFDLIVALDAVQAPQALPTSIFMKKASFGMAK